MHSTSGNDVTAEYSAVACGKGEKEFSKQLSAISIQPLLQSRAKRGISIAAMNHWDEWNIFLMKIFLKENYKCITLLHVRSSRESGWIIVSDRIPRLPGNCS
jgi:hypothetical protein